MSSSVESGSTTKEIESKCDQLFEEVFKKLMNSVERNDQNASFLGKLKQIYSRQFRDRIDYEKLLDLLNEGMDIQSKFFVYLIKLTEFLKKTQRRTAIVTPVVTAAPRPSTSPPAAATACVADEASVTTTAVKSNLNEKTLTADEQRQYANLKALCSALIRLSKEIRECEEKEIGLDELDSENSTYIVESKLKERFLHVQKKFQKIAKKYPKFVQDDEASGSDTNNVQFCLAENFRNIKQASQEKRAVSRIKNFKFSTYEEINEKLHERFGKLDSDREFTFPDFNDVYEVIEKADCGLSAERCYDEAKEVFEKIGKILKKNRMNYDRECLHSHVELVSEIFEDPAEKDPSLDAVLKENKKLACENEKKIIDEYCLKETRGEDFEVNEEDENEEEEEDADEENEEEKSEIEATRAERVTRSTRKRGSNTELITSTTNETSQVLTTTTDTDNVLAKRSKHSVFNEEIVTTTADEPSTTTTPAANEPYLLNQDIKTNLLNRLCRNSSSSSRSPSTARRGSALSHHVTTSTEKTELAQEILKIFKSNDTTDLEIICLD